MATTTVDKGKLIAAKFPGDCAECGGSILPGQMIYFSRTAGHRHRGCVDRGGDDAADPQPPRDETRRAPREPSLFDAPRGETPRAARDAAPPAAGDDAYVAPARDTAFGRAGDRDAARRELAGVLRLLIEALVRIERLLD